MVQEAGAKVTVSVAVNDKGQRSRQQVVGVIIKEALQPPLAANAEMVDAVRSLTKKQEGIWVPRHMDDDGNQRPVIFKGQGLAQVTSMSELPQPSAGQQFHIRNLYTYTEVSEAACEPALQVLPGLSILKSSFIHLEPSIVSQGWRGRGARVKCGRVCGR
jgi:hypothetical protein